MRIFRHYQTWGDCQCLVDKSWANTISFVNQRWLGSSSSVGWIAYVDWLSSARLISAYEDVEELLGSSFTFLWYWAQKGRKERRRPETTRRMSAIICRTYNIYIADGPSTLLELHGRHSATEASHIGGECTRRRGHVGASNEVIIRTRAAEIQNGSWNTCPVMATLTAISKEGGGGGGGSCCQCSSLSRCSSLYYKNMTGRERGKTVFVIDSAAGTPSDREIWVALPYSARFCSTVYSAY
jgi:hypothetical protein